MLPVEFKIEVEKQLSSLLNKSVVIHQSISVSGGSINQAYQLATNEGPFFLKTNSAKAFPGMFEAEYKGLQLLRAHADLHIPEVFLTAVFEDTSFLIMEFLEASSPDPSFWMTFAQQLANMHQQQHEHFGLDHDNYIGSLPQSNTQADSWSEFFITQRLEPMIRMGNTTGEVNRLFSKLFVRLENIFPEEKPALLHGDLWSGNYSVDANGLPAIFDPAVYYGHREMDIAMTRLFGGFDSKFYQAYNEQYPMENGWQRRIEIANLYPLMVHVNLFGGSYLESVRSTLKQFS